MNIIGRNFTKDKICVKVFKPYDDADSKIYANEEYRVS